MMIFFSFGINYIQELSGLKNTYAQNNNNNNIDNTSNIL